MMPAVRFWRQVCALVLLGVGAELVWAHKGSDAYLHVLQLQDSQPQTAGVSAGRQRDLRFTLAIAIQDLDLLVPIDVNADAKVTWGEAKAAMPLVVELVNETAFMESPVGRPGAKMPAEASPCRLDWRPDGVERRSDGAYLRLVAQARCPVAQDLSFRYALFRDQDATHRLLVTGNIAGRDLLTTTSPQQSSSLLLSAGVTAQESPVTSDGSARHSGRWSALRDYFGLGMHHLLEGYDHLAFLLALVLPLRLDLRRRAASSLTATTAQNGGTKAAWFVLLKTITAFTLGHSITLMLATFGWTQASPGWVEPVIALSVMVTALLNLRPVAWVRIDVLALLFGMVHGFGFAGLLQEAAAPSGLLPWALAGFNLGVEAGQLIAVAGWILVSQVWVARAWYTSVVVRGGSLLLVLLAFWWFLQRVI